MAQQATVPMGKFAARLMDRMAELNIRPRELANHLNRHYEQVRKLLAGTSFPSQESLTKLAQKLKMNENELRDLIQEDKKRRAFGRKFSESSIYPQKLLALAPIFERLTPDQQEMFAAQMRAVAMTAKGRKRA